MIDEADNDRFNYRVKIMYFIVKYRKNKNFGKDQLNQCRQSDTENYDHPWHKMPIVNLLNASTYDLLMIGDRHYNRQDPKSFNELIAGLYDVKLEVGGKKLMAVSLFLFFMENSFQK